MAGPRQLRDLAVEAIHDRGACDAECRWDLFNQFNHPGFGFPNATIDNPTAGRISTTIVDNRSMQFALKVNF